jgi:hypothetical protein
MYEYTHICAQQTNTATHACMHMYSFQAEANTKVTHRSFITPMNIHTIYIYIYIYIYLRVYIYMHIYIHMNIVQAEIHLTPESLMFFGYCRALRMQDMHIPAFSRVISYIPWPDKSRQTLWEDSGAHMCICMYVFIHTHIYMWVWVYVYVLIYVHAYIVWWITTNAVAGCCMSIEMSSQVCASVCICPFAYMSMSMSVNVPMFMSVYVHTYLHVATLYTFILAYALTHFQAIMQVTIPRRKTGMIIYIHTYTHTHTHTHIYIYIYIYIYSHAYNMHAHTHMQATIPWWMTIWLYIHTYTHTYIHTCRQWYDDQGRVWQIYHRKCHRSPVSWYMHVCARNVVCM